MKYQDNIDAVATLQPDYLGLIFYDKSPRYVSSKFSELSQQIKKTGVFVNTSIEDITKKIRDYQLQAVQLHGNESPEFCDALRHTELASVSHQKNLNKVQDDNSIEIIKVFSIKDEFDFSVLKSYETVCDYYLFDTKGKQPGGNGYTFNWNILENYSSTKPFFLSGGIGLDEVEQLQEFLKSKAAKYCYAIDVNSKFEIEAGFKDLKKLEEFKNNFSFRS